MPRLPWKPLFFFLFLRLIIGKAERFGLPERDGAGLSDRDRGGNIPQTEAAGPRGWQNTGSGHHARFLPLLPDVYAHEASREAWRSPCL